LPRFQTERGFGCAPAFAPAGSAAGSAAGIVRLSQRKFDSLAEQLGDFRHRVQRDGVRKSNRRSVWSLLAALLLAAEQNTRETASFLYGFVLPRPPLLLAA
jgi:hypothetical protein